jgi:heat shock protein HslJ
MSRSHIRPARPRAILALLAVLAILVMACGTTASSGSASLTGKLWQWTESTISEPTTIPDPSLYTVTFAEDGTFSAKVDCNQAAGGFTTTAEGGITITPGPMTMAACAEGSLSDVYIAGLGGATTYTVSDTELVLTTATGTMTFAPG